MSFSQALVSTLANVILLAGLPFAGYWLYHRLRHRRSFDEIRRRAGLQLGERRYLAYAAAGAAVSAGALALFPPDLESMLAEGSAFAQFEGIAPATGFALASLYGLFKTGFAEELLFRGLICGSLGRRLSLPAANLLQAAIFLLPHLLLLLFIPAPWFLLALIFAASLFLGWLRIRSESMVGPWIVHAAGNVATAMSVVLRTQG